VLRSKVLVDDLPHDVGGVLARFGEEQEREQDLVEHVFHRLRSGSTAEVRGEEGEVEAEHLTFGLGAAGERGGKVVQVCFGVLQEDGDDGRRLCI
jgi:hypothetical protein